MKPGNFFAKLRIFLRVIVHLFTLFLTDIYSNHLQAFQRRQIIATSQTKFFRTSGQVIFEVLTSNPFL